MHAPASLTLSGSLALRENMLFLGIATVLDIRQPRSHIATHVGACLQASLSLTLGCVLLFAKVLFGDKPGTGKSCQGDESRDKWGHRGHSGLPLVVNLSLLFEEFGRQDRRFEVPSTLPGSQLTAFVLSLRWRAGLRSVSVTSHKADDKDVQSLPARTSRANGDGAVAEGLWPLLPRVDVVLSNAKPSDVAPDRLSHLWHQ